MLKLDNKLKINLRIVNLENLSSCSLQIKNVRYIQYNIVIDGISRTVPPPLSHLSILYRQVQYK